MNRKPLILIGGGGHCKACIDVIEMEGKYAIEGILDVPEKIGSSVLGYTVVGSDKDIDDYIGKDCFFLITVGQIKSAGIRKRLYSKLINENSRLATIISPSAYVSKHSSIGAGTIVMHNATINAGAVIGVNCILNTGSNIEHDATIGDHCHISTHAVINGDCKVGNDVFIGSNSTLLNGVAISDNIVVAGGAVVVNSILGEGVYAGIPVRKIK